MSIDILNNKQNISGIQARQVQASYIKGSRDSGEIQNTRASDTDNVQITDTAQSMSAAAARAENATGIDPAKVASIKASIENGEYHINFDRLASNIMSKESELANALTD